MQKCMNAREDFVDESLVGIVKAYPNFYEFCNIDERGIIHRANTKRKVSIVTGGGYGHLPLFLGYVGDGLCDGIAVGNVFTSPSSETIQNVASSVRNEDGVLFLFGNYFGDSMNFDMASEMLQMEGIKTAIVKGSDDIASADRSVWEERRGIAGIVFAYKLAGACADEGADLDEVERIAKKAVSNISSFGVSFSSCTLPGEVKPIFHIEDGEMEIGMGIHGEPGIRRGKMKSAKEISRELTDGILKDLSLKETDKVAVLVNGLGMTSREELFIVYNEVSKILSDEKIAVVKSYVGEYATSMEMSGLSLSILKLDDELETLLHKHAYSPLLCL